MVTAPQYTKFINYQDNKAEDQMGGRYRTGQVDRPEPYYPGSGPRNVFETPPLNLTEAARKTELVYAADRLWYYEDLVFKPIMAKIMASWFQYNNIYESDANKDSWQSKKVTPFMFLTAERLAGAMVQFIEQRPGWFEAEAHVPVLQLFVDLMTKHLEWWITHDQVDFFSHFEEAIKSGLTTGHVHVTCSVEFNPTPNNQNPGGIWGAFEAGATANISGATDSPTTPNAESIRGLDPNIFAEMPQLKFGVVPTSQVRLDSSGANRYKMWKTVMSIGDLRHQAAARNWDLEAVERCLGRKSMFWEQQQAQLAMEKGQNRSQENPINVVELLHFEGDLHHPQTGKDLFRKSYMVVANNTEIIYGPAPMPNWDGESLMVSAPFIKAPGAVYGKSFLTESVDMMDVRHDLMNLLIDYIRLSLSPPYQLDRDVVTDRAFREGKVSVYPGKIIEIRSMGNPQANALRPVDRADLQTGFWQFIQYFTTAQQEATGMSQELMGSTRVRGRMTDGEYEKRYAEAGKLLAAIWSNLERRLLKPLLRTAQLRLLQYTPNSFWKAWVQAFKTKILPKDTSKVPPEILAKWERELDIASEWGAEERYRNLSGFFRWKVKVFNNLSQRQVEVEKLTMLLNVLAKIPGAFNVLALDKILEKVIIAFGYNPAEFGNLTQLTPPDSNALQATDPSAMMAGVSGGEIETPNLMGDEDDLEGLFASLMGNIQNPSQGITLPGGPAMPTPGLPTMPPGLR